jgi:hypothetical protein
MPSSDEDESKAKSAVTWTPADEATLVEAFKAQKNQGNMAESGWKPTAYTAVVKALEGSEKLSGGTAKTVSTVKSRWQRVSVIHCSIIPSPF